MNASETLKKIIAALDQARIPYMLTGSFASAHHGTPRSTLDLDLVIAPESEQLRNLVALLSNDEYYVDMEAALEAYRRRSMFNAIDISTGWKIDLIIRKSREFSREEFARRQLVEVQGLQIFVASAEDVVIAKLEWSRMAQSQRQIEDVTSYESSNLKLNGTML
ncbi:MAG TPA: DUF6036 family nucleotidyltransferase [Terriglobales bacterium]|jgi:hypothetical protein